MNYKSRKILDRSFTGLGFVSIALMGAALLILLVPIFWKGFGAFAFQGTVFFRQFQYDKFQRGDKTELDREMLVSTKAREKAWEFIDKFRSEELDNLDSDRYDDLDKQLDEIEEIMYELFGPRPGEEPNSSMESDNYGKTRWDTKTRELFHHLMNAEEWDYGDGSEEGVLVSRERKKAFSGTVMVGFFDYMERNIEAMMLPQLTFYWNFLFDPSFDSHYFGGIWAELLGTFYLTVGAMIFGIPLGVIAAIYLTEFAREGKVISLLRTFINTLAGVPSIVFGLFGLSFFLNTLNIGGGNGRSVLAGAMTLALLILPTIIRASEEAIRSVPHTYREAALSLGATKWRTVVSIILPSALPGILTGIVISMGRAAGETAPIIFTAAVSVGQALNISEVFSNGTPALSWNIYNLSTEHEAVDEIRHVQYGMVMSLVLLVLVMNLAAIIMRARISKKLRG